MNYYDNEPHTATAAEHIAAITNELREFCATNNNPEDYAAQAEFIEEIGATLGALYERNRSDIVTVTFADWSGFILKDEEQ